MLARKIKTASVGALSLWVCKAYTGPGGNARIGVELCRLKCDNNNISCAHDNRGTVNNSIDDISTGSTCHFEDTADPGFEVTTTKRITHKYLITAGYENTKKFSGTQYFSDYSEQLEILHPPITDELDTALRVQTNYIFALKNITLNHPVTDTPDLCRRDKQSDFQTIAILENVQPFPEADEPVVNGNLTVVD